MAVDSAQKRFSATALLFPGYTPGVVPAGAIGAALRQAVSWVYSGIAAGAPAAAVSLFIDATAVVTEKIVQAITGTEYISMALVAGEKIDQTLEVE